MDVGVEGLHTTSSGYCAPGFLDRVEQTGSWLRIVGRRVLSDRRSGEADARLDVGLIFFVALAAGCVWGFYSLVVGSLVTPSADGGVLGTQYTYVELVAMMPLVVFDLLFQNWPDSLLLSILGPVVIGGALGFLAGLLPCIVYGLFGLMSTRG